MVAESHIKEPRIVHWRDKIRTVAQRWENQYNHDGRWSRTITGDSQDVYKRLCALDVSTATPEDVRRAIGTDGWVESWCDGCHEYARVAIQLGDEPDYESATVTLCLPCFDRAVELRQGQ